MDNSGTTKRMMGAVILVLITSLLLAWLLKGKNNDRQWACFKGEDIVAFSDREPKNLTLTTIVVYNNSKPKSIKADGCVISKRRG